MSKVVPPFGEENSESGVPGVNPSSSGLRDVAQGVRETSAGRSSVIMAAGTFVSRVLGFVRQWLLVLAIGGYGVADAFNTANTLPNTLYNLLAGGILNAILVPTIVRCLAGRCSKGQDGAEQVNALLTFSAIVLLGLTVFTVGLAWPLVLLFGGGMEQSLFDLTVIFALWCLPQIFFYGAYALLGQVLNSLSSFGPYMWAPVVNNLVGIGGLAVFIFFYGTAPSHNFDVSSWGFAKVALLAGSMTLGIVVQALILVPPLQKLGFHLRPNFRWRGLGLRHTGRVAAWAFAGLLANSLMNLIITRIGSEANGAGQLAGVFYPSTSIYNYATMLYMLPQSLVTISVTTAVFTAMAYHATQNDFRALSRDYLRAVRLSSLFTWLLGGMLVVGALPLANLTASSLPPDQARALAVTLVILCLGIPGQTIYVTSARMFYSLEKTRLQFLVTIPFPLVTGVLAVFALFGADPSYWLVITVLGEPLSLWVATVLGVVLLVKQGLQVSMLYVLAGHYLRCFVAVVMAGVPAVFVLRWGFAVPGESWSVGQTFLSGFTRSVVVGLVMVPLYFFFAWVFNVREVRVGFCSFARRVRGLFS